MSCIVPAYNCEQHLPHAIASIVEQTYAPLEVIVADDGSTDGTADVVMRHEDDVLYVRQDNGGPAAARNLGLAAARGEFVAFLDADDHWHPEKLQRQIARFHAAPDLDLCFTAFQYVWELASEAAEYRDSRLAAPIASCHISSLLARRDAFDTYGLFDPDLRHGETTTWLINAKDHGARIDVLEDVLVGRRLHPDSMTRADAPEALDAFLGILRTWRDSHRRDETNGETE